MMVYPAITSCNPPPDACSSVRMVGAATLTMKASSRAMNWAASTTASSRPRRLSVPDALLNAGVGPAGAGEVVVVMPSSVPTIRYG
ncbi:hypothetical protein KY5_2696 [Streptomyces formicae]|uniref:Uncharacterized protein n=1 Tax=Streptomyces formicae TaxID=1616117 RepID=A0A291Q8G5_9ACTN|nr:hypothetical protein KY5_2696 [Streptomyces formicae]